MVMETLQIRLTNGLVKQLDCLVESGIYPNRSEAVRDSVRRLVVEHGLSELPEENPKELPEHIRELRKYCH